MKTIKAVGIKTLKDNLSAYLRDVKSGILVLITDRGNVIAELHEPTIAIDLPGENSLQLEWIRDRKLIPPQSKKKKCLPSPVKLEKGTAIHLLDQERGE